MVTQLIGLSFLAAIDVSKCVNSRKQYGAALELFGTLFHHSGHGPWLCAAVGLQHTVAGTT